MYRFARTCIQSSRHSQVIARRSVSSFLSPLGNAFNTKNSGLKLSLLGASRSDPSLVPTGLFGIEELSRPEGFGQLQVDCLRNCDALVQEATSSGDGRRRIVSRVFDDLSDELCRVADLAEFIRLAHPDSRYFRFNSLAKLNLRNEKSIKQNNKWLEWHYKHIVNF